MIDIGKLQNIVFISEDEKMELMENEGEYKELVRLLMEEHKQYMDNLEVVSNIHSQLAAINYDVHEKFMNTHKNSIVVKSYMAELKMLGIPIGSDLDQINRILDHYLILHEFQ